MTEETLWNQFNFAEDNPDPGAGILYCLRYSGSRIKGHQESVVNALKSMGIQLDDLGDRIGAKLQGGLNASEHYRCGILLEELCCMNEALKYSEIGFNRLNNIPELKNMLMSDYYGLLEKNKLNAAYDLITLSIPQIVMDLKIADHQNGVLSKLDRKELGELIAFARIQDRVLNSPRGYILLSC